MSLHPLDSLEKVKKQNLDKIKYDVHKLKEVFVDTIKFAIDKDLVKYLYTLLMLRNFYEKVGIFIGDSNYIMKTEKTEKVEIIIKKTSALLNRIVMLGEILEEIKLELSYLEIRKKYNLNILLVDTNEDMTDRQKINHLMIFIQHGLDFQHQK